MTEAVGVAHARAGLLGNPGDAYGGKALALSIFDFRARASIEPSDGFVLHPGNSDLLRFTSVAEAVSTFRRVGSEDGLRLLRAAVARFWTHFPQLARLPVDDERLRFAIRYETDIPRQVGLAGSSAIIVAAMRALASWFEVEIAPADLAELALAAEVEDLGIAAGPMDRVVQAYEGVMLMDLQEPRTDSSYTRLDPSGLPPLFVAWAPEGGESSGKPHAKLRGRWERGDPEVHEVMQALRALVDDGVQALEQGDSEALRTLIDRNFELRARIFTIAERDRRMVALAREHGAAAKLCGSGGAVIGTTEREGVLEELQQAYHRAGLNMIRPRLVAPESVELSG